jgi:hypothetical protein
MEVVSKEMSTVKFQRIGQEYCNQRYRTISSIFPLQHECKISIAASLMFSSCTVRKWMSPTYCFETMLSLNFFQKRETQQESSMRDFMVCMEMPAWVPLVS